MDDEIIVCEQCGRKNLIWRRAFIRKRKYTYRLYGCPNCRNVQEGERMEEGNI